MRNLRHFSDDAMDFFDDVLKNKRNSKKDPDYKTRVTALRPSIVPPFTEYNARFHVNALIQLVSVGFVNPNKDDLHRLYRYKDTTIQRLKTKVTTVSNNRILNTCQNCTINEISSFDHFVPKEEFSEFTVHPKNLVPSCDVCNDHKTINWRDNGTALFLNLYLDTLPEEQFLFVNITRPNDVIETEFFLENRNDVPALLYEVIESHYNRLKLCDRFSDNLTSVIVPLENSIKAQNNYLSRENIIDVTEDKAVKDKLFFGQNYWKAILTQELVRSDIFMDPLFV